MRIWCVSVGGGILTGGFWTRIRELGCGHEKLSFIYTFGHAGNELVGGLGSLLGILLDRHLIDQIRSSYVNASSDASL